MNKEQEDMLPSDFLQEAKKALSSADYFEVSYPTRSRYYVQYAQAMAQIAIAEALNGIWDRLEKSNL